MPANLQTPGAPAPADPATDLPREVQDEILRASGLVGAADHWTLLGLPWNASASAARAAYLEKVKLFHPDRHAGRRLGPWLPRLERVFKALTEAREVLGEEARRAEYARATAPPDQWAKQEARRLIDASRADERRARLRRDNPIITRASRVQELFERGRAALEAGKFTQAANDLLTVLGLDPRHPHARTLAEEARRRATAQRASELYDQGLGVEAMGQGSTALQLFREASSLAPRDPRYAVAVSRLALSAGDIAGAREAATAAVRAAPRDARALVALAAALHAGGDTREARQAVDGALAIEPDLPEARALLKRLRWSFFG